MPEATNTGMTLVVVVVVVVTQSLAGAKGKGSRARLVVGWLSEAEARWSFQCSSGISSAEAQLFLLVEVLGLWSSLREEERVS